MKKKILLLKEINKLILSTLLIILTIFFSTNVYAFTFSAKTNITSYQKFYKEFETVKNAEEKIKHSGEYLGISFQRCAYNKYNVFVINDMHESYINFLFPRFGKNNLSKILLSYANSRYFWLVNGKKIYSKPKHIITNIPIKNIHFTVHFAINKALNFENDLEQIIDPYIRRAKKARTILLTMLSPNRKTAFAILYKFFKKHSNTINNTINDCYTQQRGASGGVTTYGSNSNSNSGSIVNMAKCPGFELNGRGENNGGSKNYVISGAAFSNSMQSKLISLLRGTGIASDINLNTSTAFVNYLSPGNKNVFVAVATLNYIINSGRFAIFNKLIEIFANHIQRINSPGYHRVKPSDTQYDICSN